ncbi:MAG TPA: nuclear transport factor 2 family protein, partial [Steroidobacteraceae bacterium]
MSLQELSDRMEIEQLIVHYANSIDQRDWDGLDQVFTPDAYIDYRKLGGIDGRYPQIKAWLGTALGHFPHYCHLVGNIEITLAGDTASSRTLCINPMDTPLPAGGSQVMFL